MKKYGRPRIAKLRTIGESSVGAPTDSKYLFYDGSFYYCIEDLKDLNLIAPKINSKFKMLELRNSDSVLIFDTEGSIKILNGYAFTLNDSGIAMATLGLKNPVVSVIADRGNKAFDAMIFVTELGYGKIMDLYEVTKSAKGHVITLASEDKLAAAIPLRNDFHVDSLVGITSGDRLYYVKAVDFPRYKRSSAGNRIIKGLTGNDDRIDGACWLNAVDDPGYLFIYGDSGYIKLLDTQYLSFSKRGNNSIGMDGRKILGAWLLHGSEETVSLYLPGAAKPKMWVRVQIGAMTRFCVETGEEKKIRMSTSIGNPTRIIQVPRNGWYRFEQDS